MLTIKIKTGNDAFQYDPRPELARILRELADRVAEDRDREWKTNLLDCNGNTVGTATLTK